MAELQRAPPPRKVWIQQQDVLGSNPSSATCPTKLGVTLSVSQGCWAEPGGHGIIQWGPGVGASIVKCVRRGGLVGWGAVSGCRGGGAQVGWQLREDSISVSSQGT